MEVLIVAIYASLRMNMGNGFMSRFVDDPLGIIVMVREAAIE
tara:strand:+ start:1231 stop:1356 length:126 start_codon:yes stop_codon:yes gene_type:complete